MRNHEEADHCVDQICEPAYRPRANSPFVLEEDLRARGFSYMGGKGPLLSRFSAQIRIDAVPDLRGSYTRLVLRAGPEASVRFQLTSLAEWDTWLAAFDREYPRH